ncbi:MAG: bifunctional (p)ppGpp synthetase/guanosine-3',5'-bis(diphosphate) 3'-pyrophosphohydrolase [Candidatus Methylophosphatis roskildensis]
MVSVTHAIDAAGVEHAPVARLCEGLDQAGSERIERALELVEPLYIGKRLGTGEAVWQHGLGMALIAVSLKLDVDTRLAALLFAIHGQHAEAAELIEREFGHEVATLVTGLHRLNGLRLISRATAVSDVPQVRAQTEVLRKMLLAMVEDIRVVLLRLASRTQTLRYFTDHDEARRAEAAREALDIYAPLANRLGVWQLKWELEDLSFRFIEPETYKRIARQLDEKRAERERFIEDAILRLKNECAAIGIEAEIYGRPKHIYSIWNKMRTKGLAFGEVYDVRALRVIVEQVKDCYTVLGLVHQRWSPVPKEFDDYISKPKGNFYQSLHTAVIAEDGRSMEVQIRTREMHNHAELGVAAHWRYKEGVGDAKDAYGDKLALLRELLSWRDEIAGSSDWVEQFKRAALDDTIYIVTPQGRVIDLPQGATPIDFAYRLHTELGHRCRGAKVDGALVPLNTRLKSGQTVEIVSTKQGGPSRDWLNPQLGYLHSSRARAKVKQWFATQDEAQTLADGRAWIGRELQREGATQANIDELAGKLGFSGAEAMFLAAGRNELGPRAVHVALRGPVAPLGLPEFVPRKSRAGDKDDGVLVVGVGKLLTQLGRCCKPAPPDAIKGYVTRGKGVSIHRADCPNFANMARVNPERVIAADWGQDSGEKSGAVYPVEIAVECADRTGLLRDISEVLSREKINVIAVNTMSRQGRAFMSFTMEVSGVPQIQRALKLIGDVPSVLWARRT